MTKSEAYYEKMTKTPVSKLITRLGIPTTVSMLITNIYNLADTYFIGSLGESAQGAVGVVFTLQAIIQAFSFMLGHGSGIFVSKSLADKDIKSASKYVSSAFFLGGAFGIFFSAVSLIFMTPFMRFIGSTDTILPYAKDYAMWILISCPFLVCSLILNNNLRYEGKAFYAMFGLTSGGIVNILLDYIFVMKAGLGVFGAGMATAISQIISFSILLIMYIKNAQSKIKFKYVSRKTADYVSIMRVGLPSLIRQGLTSISNGILNNAIKPYGDSAIAAMSIVNRYSSFVMCVGLGIGQGFQPVASFNYQAKKYSRVKKGLFFTTFVSVAIVGMVSVLGIAFSEKIVYVFQSAKSVIDIGSPALKYASVGLLFMPLSVPVNMLNQSIGNAKTASFLSLLRSGVIFIPTVLIMANTVGLTGITLSQPIADIITGIISIFFILKFVKFVKLNPDKDDGENPTGESEEVKTT